MRMMKHVILFSDSLLLRICWVEVYVSKFCSETPKIHFLCLELEIKYHACLYVGCLRFLAI
jgi:hypothetical protein